MEGGDLSVERVMRKVGQELPVKLLEEAEVCRDHLLLFLGFSRGVDGGRWAAGVVGVALREK